MVLNRTIKTSSLLEKTRRLFLFFSDHHITVFILKNVDFDPLIVGERFDPFSGLRSHLGLSYHAIVGYARTLGIEKIHKDFSFLIRYQTVHIDIVVDYFKAFNLFQIVRCFQPYILLLELFIAYFLAALGLFGARLSYLSSFFFFFGFSR